MMERDQLVQRLRESVAPGKPDYAALADAAESYLGFYKRSKAITADGLTPVRVDAAGGIHVEISDDDGEVDV